MPLRIALGLERGERALLDEVLGQGRGLGPRVPLEELADDLVELAAVDQPLRRRSQTNHSHAPRSLVTMAMSSLQIRIGDPAGCEPSDGPVARPARRWFSGHPKLGRVSGLSNSLSPVFRRNPTRYPAQNEPGRAGDSVQAQNRAGRACSFSPLTFSPPVRSSRLTAHHLTTGFQPCPSIPTSPARAAAARNSSGAAPRTTRRSRRRSSRTSGPARGRRRRDQGAAQAHPDKPAVWGYYAQFLYNAGQPREGRGGSRAGASKLNPNFGMAHFLRGQFRENEGELIGSLLLYRKAAEAYDPEAHDAAHQRLPEDLPARDMLNRPVAARAALERAVHFQPGRRRTSAPNSRRVSATDGPLPDAARKKYTFRPTAKPVFE